MLDLETASESEMQLAEGRFDGDAGKRRNAVKFYKRIRFNPERSKEEKRTVCDSVDYVRIQCPGDKLNIVDKEVTEQEKRDYPLHYAAYLADATADQDAATGTLLSLTGYFSPERIEELAHSFSGRIRTAEQYASASDEVLQRLGPAASKERAFCVTFVEQATRAAPVAKLQGQIEERDARIAAMEKNLADLTLRFAEKGIEKNAESGKRAQR